MQKKQYIYIKRFTNAYSSDFRITNPKKQVWKKDASYA